MMVPPSLRRQLQRGDVDATAARLHVCTLGWLSGLAGVFSGSCWYWVHVLCLVSAVGEWEGCHMWPFGVERC